MAAINRSRSAGLRSLYTGSVLIRPKCLPSVVSAAAASAGKASNWAGLGDAWHVGQKGGLSVTAYGGPEGAARAPAAPRSVSDHMGAMIRLAPHCTPTALCE